KLDPRGCVGSVVFFFKFAFISAFPCENVHRGEVFKGIAVMGKCDPRPIGVTSIAAKATATPDHWALRAKARPPVL
ncbi:MAG: hypothetical protein VX622_16930, partial [Pseudomonadota bacterium]|nr:hypothetical protein [Pseudomonadota bacterium]